MDNQQVAIKMYNKAKLSASKLRAIKREAAMMIYMTRKRSEIRRNCVHVAADEHWSGHLNEGKAP